MIFCLFSDQSILDLNDLQSLIIFYLYVSNRHFVSAFGIQKSFNLMSRRDLFDDRLTPMRLWSVFFVQWNEGYQINVILPFVVFMCRDFGFNEDQIGIYAGLLTATFALTQFISSYFWGWASDLYGRRKILLIGIVMSGIAILIFGASTTYLQAIIARSIAGIFNGNVGVVKAYVADITTKKNRALSV